MSSPAHLPTAATIASDRPTAATRGSLAALSLAMLLASLGTSVANVALPSLAVAFSASFPQVQWVVLAYLLAITSLIVSAGRLGDLVGRRRLLLGGMAVFTGASLLAGLAPTLSLLIAARTVQGLGAAVMMSLTLAFVADAIPKAGTGRAMGLLGTMSAVGTALGPSLGGALIAGFGWRAVFLINLPLGIAALLLGRRFLPVVSQPSAVAGARFDGLGTLLLAFSLGSYALAMTVGRGQFGPASGGLLLAAGGGAALFAFAESRVISPLLPMALFRDASLRTSLGLTAIVSTVIMATLVVGPFYLALGLGLRPAQVGLAMTLGPLVAAVTGVPGGRLTDKFGAPPVVQLGLAGMTAGTLLLALLPATAGIFGYLASIALVTAGYGFFQTANNTAVMAGISGDQRGIVSGLLNLSRHLGLITGAAVLGAVFSAGTGMTDINHAIPAELAAGLRATFGVAALFVLIALAVSRFQPNAGSTTGTALDSKPAPAARTSRK